MMARKKPSRPLADPLLQEPHPRNPQLEVLLGVIIGQLAQQGYSEQELASCFRQGLAGVRTAAVKRA